MAYTPELDLETSALIRRIAWAAGKPMTSVLESLVLMAAQSIDSAEVCGACRDTSRCAYCLLKAEASRVGKELTDLVKDR